MTKPARRQPTASALRARVWALEDRLAEARAESDRLRLRAEHAEQQRDHYQKLVPTLVDRMRRDEQMAQLVLDLDKFQRLLDYRWRSLCVVTWALEKSLGLPHTRSFDPDDEDYVRPTKCICASLT